MAIAPLDSNIIYSGSSDGLFFATFNRGANWHLRNAGLPGARTISDIIVSPADPLIVYLSVDQASGGRLFQSFDGGLTWGDKTGSLAAGHLRAMSLAIDFATNTIYLGTDYGVYATHDTGMTWAQEALNLPSVAVYDAHVDALNGWLVVATHGRGMWRASLRPLGPLPLAHAVVAAEFASTGDAVAAAESSRAAISNRRRSRSPDLGTSRASRPNDSLFDFRATANRPVRPPVTKRV